MPSLTGTMPSRIGFRGTEDLGNGLKALFVLENGFGPDTGMQGQGGRLFGRNAYVGLQGAWGTLTLGRQVNMTYIAGLKSDVMGPHVYAVSNLDPYLPNARSDNAIGYTGKFSDFTVGATYSFGRDASAAGGPASTNCAGEVPHNAKACRQFTTMLDYDNKSWGMAGSYDRLYGNAGVIFGGLTSSNYYDQRIALNGFFMLDKTKFGAGLIQRTTHTASDVKSNLYYAGSSTPFAGNWVLDAQASHLDVKDSPNDTTLLAARVMYNLSRRTAVYATVGHVRNRGTAAVAVDAGGTIGAGMSQSGIMTGVRHFF
jgi:predicted porin